MKRPIQLFSFAVGLETFDFFQTFVNRLPGCFNTGVQFVEIWLGQSGSVQHFPSQHITSRCLLPSVDGAGLYRGVDWLMEPVVSKQLALVPCSSARKDAAVSALATACRQ